MTNTPFVDVPAHLAPFTIELFDADSVADNNPLWSCMVDQAGVVEIPSARSLGAIRVRGKISWADGTVTRG